MSLTADRLVLSAGTLGTTYLLLKQPRRVPGLSDRLGTHFCGNGDLLTFAHALRLTAASRPTVNSDYGPVITSAIRFGDSADADGVGRPRLLH